MRCGDILIQWSCCDCTNQLRNSRKAVKPQSVYETVKKSQGFVCAGIGVITLQLSLLWVEACSVVSWFGKHRGSLEVAKVVIVSRYMVPDMIVNR